MSSLLVMRVSFKDIHSPPLAVEHQYFATGQENKPIKTCMLQFNFFNIAIFKVSLTDIYFFHRTFLNSLPDLPLTEINPSAGESIKASR